MSDKTSVGNEKKNEYHVASFVASAMAEQLTEVQTFIADTEGAEIHATSDKGKIVFTLEGDSHKSIGIKIDYLKDHAGIINLSPVYHQYLAEESNDNQSVQIQEPEQQKTQLN
jgi:nitrate reductase NapD